MDSLLKKMFGWLGESNRMNHLGAGFIIYVLLMMISPLVLDACVDLPNRIYFSNSEILKFFSIMSLITVFISMCSVEFIQQYSKLGDWDWLDVLAGCLPELVITISILIFW